MPRARPFTSLALAAIGLGLVAAMAACVPADGRPTLGTAPVDSLSREPTGNADVDRLLARLDAVGDKTFSASYQIERKLGEVDREARVVQAPPETVVRIGDVALFHAAPQQTCDSATGTCEDGLLEQRISDVGISSGFYGPSTAQQLRVAVGRETGSPTLDTQQVGGVVAECAHVPVGGGVETYCVNGDGVIALLDTAAMHIQLTSYSPVVDAADLQRLDQASTTTSP